MKKRILTTLLTVTVVAALLTGCGGGSGSSGASGKNSDGQTTLNFYYWDEGQKEGMDAMIDLFEQENSDIKIESTVIPWSEYWTKLQTSLPNGTGPDVFWMNLYAQPYVEEGLIYDLADAIEADGVDMSVFPETVLEAYSQDGHIYGIPKDYDGIGIYYNKAIFDEMKLDYPQAGWDWDDFLDTAQKLTNGDHYGYASTSEGETGYRSFILSNGGSFVTDDYSEALYDTKESVEALQFLHDMMYVQKCSPTAAEMVETDPSDMFIGGQVAMVLNGSWKLSAFQEALGEELGIVEVPRKLNGATPTSGLALSVSAKSNHIDEAVRFVEFAATKEAQDSMVSAAIPANADSAKAWTEYYSECPDAQVLVDSINESVSNPIYGNGKTQEGEQIMNDAVNSIWMDEKADIQNAMDQVVEDLNQLVENK